VPPDQAEAALAAMRAHPLGADAAILGTVTDDPDCFVEMETAFGGRRMVDWIAGEQLPRIC
jgi:hydrogenase expression/formation protein HypE